MLFLLRKIRRTLLSNRKIPTYFFYASGEILLVVAGILIAVQIDDWNNDRLQKKAELNYFKNLKKDLQDDVKSFEKMSGIAENKVAATNRIRSLINQDTVGSIYKMIRDIETLVFVGEFTPHRDTYEEMKSTGSFSNLNNQKIKLALLDLYDSYLAIDGGQIHIRNDYEVFLEDLQKQIDMGAFFDLPNSDLVNVIIELDSAGIQSNYEEIDKDFRWLIKSNVFRNNIFLFEVNYRYFVPIYENNRSKAQNLITIIDKELNQD